VGRKPALVRALGATPILACQEAVITLALRKPLTSGAKADGRFGKQDFAYLPEEDAYRCPAGERRPHAMRMKDGKMLRRCWIAARRSCSIKSQWTPGSERWITRPAHLQ
jgi:hypothetical protein